MTSVADCKLAGRGFRMAVHVATGRKPKAKTSPRSGSGSFGYPWGTERPNTLNERLGLAQFTLAEDEIREIEAEAKRKIRQIRMRVAVLDQIRHGVQKCCTMKADGKLRFNRKLADAAGALFDVSMACEVVDLDRRRPGRPSATANAERQALRAVMRELVHDPAAEYRRRQIEGSVAPDGGGGSECKTRRHPISVVGTGEVAGGVSPLTPASDIVVPPVAETEVEASLTGRHSDLTTVTEAEPEPEPMSPPESDPDVLRAIAADLAETDMASERFEWNGALEVLVTEDPALPFRMPGGGTGYFPSHSRERQALREKRLNAELLPADQREPILPELTSDPNKPIPALVDVIWGMGLPWDKDPREASEAELRAMLDVSASNELGYLRVSDDGEWDRTLRRAGSLAEVARRFDNLLQGSRESEALRREVWPLVLARRDCLNALRFDVASGKITYSPLSDHVEDMEKSLEYSLFKRADFDLLNSLHEHYWRKYCLIVDNLDWPKGLSRRELYEKFGAGESPDEIPNLCVYDPRYPNWLVPPHFRAIENAGLVAHINQGPMDISILQRVAELEPNDSLERRAFAALADRNLLYVV